MEMGRNAGLAAAAVCLLCCVFLPGADSAYSVPADPRRPTWQPSPSPAAARRGHYHHHGHGPAASPSPRQGHRDVSPVPAWPQPHYYFAPAPAPPQYHPAPAPAPTAGSDDLPSLPPPAYARAPSTPQQATTTPHFGFPLEPTVGVAAARPAGAPGTAGGEGYPFIGSNPTVPLPTGVTDTATVLPLPDTAGGKVLSRAAAGPGRARAAAMIGLLLVLSTVLLLSSWPSS